MSVRHRYFTAAKGSPMHAELERIHKAREQAFPVLSQFMKRHGITNMRGSSPSSYVFDFKSIADADDAKWSKTKARRGEFFFRPKRNTVEGKALAKEVKALPALPDFREAISAIPGLCAGPMVFAGGYCYTPFIRYYHVDSGTLVVSVPWRDYEPEKLEAYVKQANSEKRHSWDSGMDFAQWTPSDWLVEIKEWEALKMIDEEGQA